MTKYVTYRLGQDALRYIRDRLSLGHDLAQLILKRVQLEHGTIEVHLPANVAIDRLALRDFSSGGKLPPRSKPEWRVAPGPEPETVRRRMVPIPDTSEFLGSLIMNYLSQSGSRLCIFEDANARITDDRITRLTTPLVYSDSDVYYVLNGPKVDRRQVRQLLRDADSWLVIGALGAMPEGVAIMDRSQVTVVALDRIASAVDRVIVGAYDGEGYLVWSSGQDHD